MKRSFDLLISFLGLLSVLPLLLVISLAVKLDSKGGVFYKGERVGKNGKKFRILKYRTMVEGAEELGGPSTALNDPRLTKMGKFLRRYKLDEFPQLFNVIEGNMSIVGPRPQVEKYTSLYSKEEKMILNVRPGLTDYATLRFINMDKILGDGNVDEKYFKEIEPEKNRLRIQYVKEACFWVDMKILAMTFWKLFRME